MDDQVDDIVCRTTVKHEHAIWSFDESECILKQWMSGGYRRM